MSSWWWLAIGLGWNLLVLVVLDRHADDGEIGDA